MRRIGWQIGLPLSMTIAACGSSSDPAACVQQPQLCDGDDVVVSASWLADVGLASATVQVVDVRSAGDYERERIPGALHLPEAALREVADGVSGQVASPETGAEVLSAAGVAPGAEVVVYGNATDTAAARVLWTLQYYGHSPVRLLDGGWRAWTEDGYPTSTGAPIEQATSYSVDEVDAELRVDADWVFAHLDDPGVSLVDARSSGEYEEGRIPGALHVSWTRTVASGRFRPPEDLAALYGPIDPSQTVITYCQTGSRASVAYLSLVWLGYQDVRVYDGSWAEWGSREDLPREGG